MEQRAFRAHGDSGRERQRRRPVPRTALSAAAPAVDVSGRRKRRTRRASNQMRFDQIAVANPETLAVGCPFCMTMMEDAVKSRSLEEKLRTRDLSELTAESTTIPTK